VAQLYHRALGSLFVISYDSLGYGGDILTRLLSFKLKLIYDQRPVKVEVKLRPTVSRPVHFGVRHPSGTRDQFFFLS
jgi:hypothetical protein